MKQLVTLFTIAASLCAQEPAHVVVAGVVREVNGSTIVVEALNNPKFTRKLTLGPTTRVRDQGAVKPSSYVKTGHVLLVSESLQPDGSRRADRVDVLAAKPGTPAAATVR